MFKQFLASAVILAACATGGSTAETIDLGGAGKGTPSTVFFQDDGDDYVAVFVTGPQSLMYANVGDTDSGDWTGWVPIGTEALKGSPSCVALTPTRIDCVAVGANNAVMHVRYNSKSHKWSKWESLGGFATSDPSAVRTVVFGKEQLNIFVRGPQDLLFVNTFANGGWSDWQNIGVTTGNQLGCGNIFVIGAHCYDTTKGSALQYTDVTRQTGANVVVDDLGGAIAGKPSVVTMGSKGDTLRVFVHGPSDRLWLKKWHNGWTEWEHLSAKIYAAPSCAMGKAKGPAVCAAVEPNGAVKVILLGNDEI